MHIDNSLRHNIFYVFCMYSNTNNNNSQLKLLMATISTSPWLHPYNCTIFHSFHLVYMRFVYAFMGSNFAYEWIHSTSYKHTSILSRLAVEPFVWMQKMDSSVSYCIACRNFLFPSTISIWTTRYCWLCMAIFLLRVYPSYM